MFLPKFMYGTYQDTKRNSQKLITQLKKGKPWEEVTECPLIETRDNNGLIVLEGPSPLVDESLNFNIYFLTGQIGMSPNYPVEKKQEIFNKCLNSHWGTLSLMARGGNQFWFTSKERYLPFLKSVLKYWDIYILEGNRFSWGTNVESSIWNPPLSHLHYVLANLGVPQNILKSPLPPGGLEEIIKKYISF